MALFQAFRAVRPASEKAEKVAALPYDVVSREEAREIGEKNSESFLHIDRAEMVWIRKPIFMIRWFIRRQGKIWIVSRKKGS